MEEDIDRPDPIHVQAERLLQEHADISLSFLNLKDSVFLNKKVCLYRGELTVVAAFSGGDLEELRRILTTARSEQNTVELIFKKLNG